MDYQIGQVILKDEPVTINEKREAIEIVVNNTGDRPIQVCSHYHFFEANPALRFDRAQAFGMHLDIPSGMAVRFEPGENKKVNLVPYAGKQKITGFRGMTMGVVTDGAVRAAALEKAGASGMTTAQEQAETAGNGGE